MKRIASVLLLTSALSAGAFAASHPAPVVPDWATWSAVCSLPAHIFAAFAQLFGR